MTPSPSRPPAQEMPRLLPRPPHAMRRRISRAAALALLPALAVAASGCDVLTADLKHSETAKWEKTYQLAEGGRVEIRNVNGKITVEPSTGNTVEVVAVKTARGATGEAARAELGRIEITEQASSDAVRIETKVARGESWFGGGTQVTYTVRVPASAETRFVTVNGGVNVTGLNGKTTLETTNGGVVGAQYRRRGRGQHHQWRGRPRGHACRRGRRQDVVHERRPQSGAAVGREGIDPCQRHQRRHRYRRPGAEHDGVIAAASRRHVERRRTADQHSRHERRRHAAATLGRL